MTQFLRSLEFRVFLKISYTRFFIFITVGPRNCVRHRKHIRDVANLFATPSSQEIAPCVVAGRCQVGGRAEAGLPPIKGVQCRARGGLDYSFQSGWC